MESRETNLSPRMLIQFETPAYATITMFDDVARKLLELMGMSGAIPGALKAEDVPGALERLQQALKKPPSFVSERDHNEVEGQPVNFANRAYPLVQLLSAAAKRGEHVIWSAVK
jgi:hypothetical protein